MKTRFVVALAVVFSLVAATAEAAPGQIFKRTARKCVTCQPTVEVKTEVVKEVTVTKVVASPVADCDAPGVCCPVLRSVVAAPVRVVKGAACAVKCAASQARARHQCRVASRRASRAAWYRSRSCCN